ncbi:MAG: heparan-alpha-glucosaminide N-acetyltransferase [Burkholderiaceae bacterium]
MPAGRFERLDALRGTAIVWMAVFHFCFDLSHFKFIQQNFYTDPFWTVQRTMIVSMFMFVAGVGQAIALQQDRGWQRFWRRWAQIAACAVLVSAGSALMFPKSFISFGVLHGLALMLIIVRLSQGAGAWLWLAGLLAIGLPQWLQHPWFDTRWTNWIGLVTRKPITEDYAPVLPWLGVMWWGLACGRWVLARRPAWLAGGLPRGARGLALLGRWSLSFYMLHQPVLIGAVLLVSAMR